MMVKPIMVLILVFNVNGSLFIIIHWWVRYVADIHFL